MYPAIDSLVDQFEARKLSRRELVASLTALVASAASGASAQTPGSNITTLAQGRSLNHASLAVTDVQKAADFYGRLFNIKVVNMSLGAYSTNINTVQARVQGEAALIAQLESLGVTVVSASGNNYASFETPGAETPAAFSTISVANTALAYTATARFLAPRKPSVRTSRGRRGASPSL